MTKSSKRSRLSTPRVVSRRRFRLKRSYEYVDVLIIAVVLCARADFSSPRCVAHLARRRAGSSIALVAVILAVLRLDVHVRRLDRGLRQDLGVDAHTHRAHQSRLEPPPGEPLLLDGPEVPALVRHADEERHERVQGDAAWPEAYHHHRDRARRNDKVRCAREKPKLARVGRRPRPRNSTLYKRGEEKASELFKTEYTYDVEEIAQFAGVVVLHLLD